MSDTLGDVQQKVRSDGSGWKDTLGRVGLAGRGVLYAIIALLALQLALGSPDEQTSSQGAFAWIAERPLGKVFLVVMTLALFALAAWRFLDAAVGDPVDGDEATDRVRFLAKGVVYLALAIGSASVTISNWGGSAGGSGGGDGKSQKMATAVVLDWPMGQWIVGVAGLAVIGYAIYMFKHHAIDASFEKRLDTSSEAVRRFGQIGYGARSVVWALVGYLTVRAAVTYNPDEAGGLSAALQELAAATGGRLLLGVVALGLFGFGAFCLAEAKYRRAA